MLNLRPFFQLKENVPICTIRFFFYYQIRKLLQFRKLSLHLIFSYVSSKVQVSESDTKFEKKKSTQNKRQVYEGDFFQILWHSQNILPLKGEGRKLDH